MATLSFTAIPSPDVVGLAVQSGIKSAGLSWVANPDVSFEIWAGPSTDVTAASKIGSTTANSYFVTSLNADTYFFLRTVNEFGTFGGFCPGAKYTLALVTSGDVNNYAVVSASSLGVSASNSSGGLPSYETWVTAASAGFTPTSNSIVSLTMYVVTTISGVGSTGLFQVFVRSRLHDNTLNIDVPAGIRQNLIYQNQSGISYGPLSNITNVTENFVSGFRGLLVPGHSYTLYIDVMKHTGTGGQAGGTGTVQINAGGVTVSGAASF